MIAPVICPTGLLPAALVSRGHAVASCAFDMVLICVWQWADPSQDAMKKLCARIGGTVISAYNENGWHFDTANDVASNARVLTL